MSDSAVPVRADAPAVLVQLTDMHLFDEPHTAMLGVDTEASLQAVLRQVGDDGLNPDALLATGDLSQRRFAGLVPAPARPAGANRPAGALPARQP